MKKPNARCCKVVALYAPREVGNEPGNTRVGDTNSPIKLEDWMECVNRLVEGETNVYPGDNISLDLHLVWNRESHDDEKDIEKFIYSFDGKRINTGRIYVSEKPNWGHGFEVFGKVATEYYDDYEYWCFQEDDHYIIDTAKGYFAQAIKQLEEENKFKFVSFTPIVPGGLCHFGAAFGVWHRTEMDMDEFPFTEETANEIHRNMSEYTFCKWLLNSFQDTEILNYQRNFVNKKAPTIMGNGCLRSWDIIEHIKGYSNAPENWTQLTTYVRCTQHPHIDVDYEKPFIFKVGLESC